MMKQPQRTGYETATQTIGGYAIDAPLGEGAVAVVFLAHLLEPTIGPSDDHPLSVALKVLRPEAVRQPRVLASFQYETRVLARLNHPGIMRVYASGIDDDRVYAAMQLIRGVGLDAYLLSKKKLPLHTAVDIAGRVADALNYLHESGYVHRDLKPSNVMLSAEGKAVLTDFGTVIKISDGAPYEVGLYGTPAFIAPEQIVADGKIDGRADLYALGMMLYLMVAGRKPFYGTRQEVLDAHLHQAPPSPSEFAAVPSELETIILKAIAKQPHARYQTGADFLAALQALELSPATPQKPSLGQRLLGLLRAGA
jgi:serine/threonine protein kinase